MQHSFACHETNSTALVFYIFYFYVQPSPMVCEPAYSKPVVPKPGSMVCCGRKGMRRKNTLGCTAGLTHCGLCGCCRPASGHTMRGVSERGPAIRQNSECKGSVSSCSWTRVSFVCVPRVLTIVLDHRGTMGSRGERRLGVLVRNARTMQVVYCDKCF